MIKDAYEIFNKISASEIKEFAIYNGTESLLLEVSGSESGIDIDIKGKINLKENNYTSLSIIDMSNLTVISKITAAGNYMVSVSGISYIKLIANSIGDSDLTIYGRGLS